VDNDKRFHLYSLAAHAGSVYIAGEQGLLLRLNAAGERFERVETPYNGTFFGVDVADAGQVLVYGLRGNAYFSVDAGGNWRKLETGTDANIVGATQSRDRVTLVSQTGEILGLPTAGGAAQRLHVAAGPDVYGAVTIAPNRMAVARLNGPALLEWAANP